MPDKISLSRQIAAVETELKERRSGGARSKLSTSQIAFQRDGLESAANTLRWLQQHEARIKRVAGE